MSSDASSAALATGFGSSVPPQGAGVYRAVARVALSAADAVEIDLRAAADLRERFAPFESVQLLWACATLHVNVRSSAATVACGWIPNTLTASQELIEGSFDGCEISTATTSGVTAVVPLTETAFGRELKALVTGNAAPSFAASATPAVGFIKVKICFSASGSAIA